MINTYIPYLGSTEKRKLNHCINSNFISSVGPDVKKFEQQFSKLYGYNFSVALNSGTSALHAALLSINISKNDIVIIPSYTFAATANAIIYIGAHPLFSDIDNNFLLCLKNLENFLNKKTIMKNNKLFFLPTKQHIKAIIPVQTFGQKMNFRKYEKFAKKYNLSVIFDSAACHDPLIFRERKKIKSIFCFSFNGNKTITTGAGGMLCTNSKKIHDKVKLLAKVGKSKTNYDYVIPGYNYVMSNLQASVGRAQLDKLKKIIKIKRGIFKNYFINISKNKNFQIINDLKYTNWVFVLIAKNKKTFDQIFKLFKKNKIQINYFWKPLHLQAPYKNYPKTNLENSIKLWNKVIILPSHPNLSIKNINKVCKVVNTIK